MLWPSAVPVTYSLVRCEKHFKRILGAIRCLRLYHRRQHTSKGNINIIASKTSYLTFSIEFILNTFLILYNIFFNQNATYDQLMTLN